MALRARPRTPGGVYYATGTVARRRIRQSLGTCDRAAAEEAASALETRLRREALYGPEAVVTFEDAALSYMESGGEARFLAPLLIHFRGTRLAAIKPGHVLDAARALYPEASWATRRRQAITPAVAVIHHGHARGWCAPIRVRAPNAPAPARQAVGRDYIDRLRAACLAHSPANPHLAAAMLFLHQTGARLSEMLALTRADLDLAAGTAIARRTKNGEPRVIHLTAELAAELAALPERRGRCHGPLFGYRTKNGLYRALRRICAEAGLDYLGTHQPGRHSFATALHARHGWTAEEIAAAGGWKSPQLVSRTYIHTEGAGRRAAAALGGLRVVDGK
ncbi:MAG: hypothetical protein Tsb0020_50250 [Haliangiales bacterium]